MTSLPICSHILACIYLTLPPILPNHSFHLHGHTLHVHAHSHIYTSHRHTYTHTQTHNTQNTTHTHTHTCTHTHPLAPTGPGSPPTHMHPHILGGQAATYNFMSLVLSGTKHRTTSCRCVFGHHREACEHQC